MVAAHAGDLSQAPSSQLVAGALSGCYFTLAAVRGTEDEARALALIRESGGRVFTDTTLQRVAGGWRRRSASGLMWGRALCRRGTLGNPPLRRLPSCWRWNWEARHRTHNPCLAALGWLWLRRCWLFSPPHTRPRAPPLAPRSADKGRAYAICPTSLLPQDATQLRGACPDFRLGERWARCGRRAQRSMLSLSQHGTIALSCE
jgi:hypothetical protein